MKLEVLSNNQKDTENFAFAFAKIISAPCIILLAGDLGAGKTTFVKGVAKALGCKDDVTSPTYTLMNTYLCPNNAHKHTSATSAKAGNSANHVHSEKFAKFDNSAKADNSANPGETAIYHFDMYRLSSAEEALGAGFAEYFDKKTLDGIVFVEWPENVDGLISNWDFKVEILKVGENSRKIVVYGGEE